MKISYDGEFWQIWIELTDKNIETLKEKKELHDDTGFLNIDDRCRLSPEPSRDAKDLTKILGINISQQLFDLFLEACENPDSKKKSYIERIWCSLSVELIRV